MKIAFVGLGKMGKPMAMNMLKTGAEMIVCAAADRSFAKFRSKGARATKDIAETVEAEIIFLCLPNGEVVRDVLLGERGIARKLGPGQAVVDTSTITHATTLEVAKALEERGVEFLDAPVSGMEARAIDGTLTIMCGGKPETFERAKPFLDAVGNKILYMGGTGSGQLTKLINQLLFDINCAALAEILPMAVKMGLDCVKVGEVVNTGTGRSYASEFFIPRILKNGFDAGYPMKDAYKDLVSAVELGAMACIPMPVLAAATATYQTALLRGHGAKDKGGMVQVFEELLGVRFREPPQPSD